MKIYKDIYSLKKFSWVIRRNYPLKIGPFRITKYRTLNVPISNRAVKYSFILKEG